MFADLRTANGVDLRAHAQITGIVTENGHATESEERVLIRGDLSSREFVAFLSLSTGAGSGVTV